MKNTIYTILFAAATLSMTTSCSDWLDVKPKNEQISTEYWQSKEEVEAVVNSGYYRLREAVPTLIEWGELRGDAMYSTNTTFAKLQNFLLTASDGICDYSKFYQAIAVANSVIKYAPGVQAKDETYADAQMKAHLCEAYFQRAFCYLVLVKNFKEVPLVTEPYVDDSHDFNIAKATEEQIIAQIKKDVESALATNAAKSTYENDWETKGRATKWALYALMADACLWSEDYDGCIKYCDLILNADQSGDTFYPKFLSKTEDWYTMFYPGNSNESIFELNWDYNTEKKNNNLSGMFPSTGTGGTLNFTNAATQKMATENETVAATSSGDRTGRMNLASYVNQNGNYILWKYRGNDVADIEGGVRINNDANFILYRVAEIILMKAQAEAMKGDISKAIDLDNMIRVRAGLSAISEGEKQNYSEETVLDEILDQKELEFLAEGKRWYDLLWLARIGNHKYKNKVIDIVANSNQTTNADWIKSTLVNDYAWYMPLSESELKNNQLLVQNPYYSK